MRILYHLIVLYMTILLVCYLFREKNFWKQAGLVLVLVLFLLRLFLIE
jgi:hypothetical protein